MGINRNFPRAVVHGPQSHQGLDLPNLFTEQIIAHVMMLLRFGPQLTDLTGHLLTVNTEAFHLEVGLSGPVFKLPLKIADYMMASWFTQTWINCWLLDIKISTDTYDYEQPRKNDKEIMFFSHME